jgi:N-acetylglucosaminyl-diphospho-decaprenol L-rhamnosyltransferase
MKQVPELSIIIVNWNSKDFVRKCVQSIMANLMDFAFEIIVVDGASYDGCGEMLMREFPEVRFIQSDKNVGFARASNLGFEQSSGNCLLFLNPDTEVVGPAISILRTALLELDQAGIVGAKLLNTDGSVQTSCIQAFPTILNQLWMPRCCAGHSRGIPSGACRRCFPLEPNRPQSRCYPAPA